MCYIYDKSQSMYKLSSLGCSFSLNSCNVIKGPKYLSDLHRNSTIGYMSTMYNDKMSVTTEAPSPSTALSANSGTGNQEGRPTIRPSRSHSSDKRTGLGAVPLMTPSKHEKVRLLSICYYNTINFNVVHNCHVTERAFKWRVQNSTINCRSCNSYCCALSPKSISTTLRITWVLPQYEFIAISHHNS